MFDWTQMFDWFLFINLFKKYIIMIFTKSIGTGISFFLIWNNNTKMISKDMLNLSCDNEDWSNGWWPRVHLFGQNYSKNSNLFGHTLF